MKKTVIVIAAIACALLLCVGFYNLKNHSGTGEEAKDMTTVQKIDARNLEQDYPKTPRAVLKLYNEIIKKGLSVRQVEALVTQWQEAEEKGDNPTVAPKRLKNSDYDMLKKHLSQAFKTKVQFSCSPSGKGKITFPFDNEAELEKLICIFDKLKESE